MRTLQKAMEECFQLAEAAANGTMDIKLINKRVREINAETKALRRLPRSKLDELWKLK
jgi:hypothetical protein